MKNKFSLNFLLSVFIILFVILGLISISYDSQKKYDDLILKRNKNFEKLIPGYHYRLYDNKKLKNFLNIPISNFNLDEVNSLIFNSLAHYELNQDIRDNLILYIFSKFHAGFSQVKKAQKIINTGVGFCNQAVIVLNQIAKINNKDFRTIQLTGHVVTEIKISNNWYYADPDYGFTLPISYQELINLKKQEVQKIISQKLLSNGFNNYTVKKYLNELLSIEDNSIDSENSKQTSYGIRRYELYDKIEISTLKFNNIIIFLIITVLLGILLKRKKFF